jgi:putative nucleotidyltransferase-like protein
MPQSNTSLMASTMKLLLLALRRPAEVVDLETRDLDLLIRLARRARLHGRIAAEMTRGGFLESLPMAARDQFESALVMAQARERVALWELDRIQWVLEGWLDFPIVCLKGAAYVLLELPNVPGRIFVDVDLLVAEEKLGELECALNNAGWSTQQLNPYDDNYYRRWTHELPPLMYFERDVEIDLHHNILPRTARLSPSSSKIMRASSQLAGSMYSVPCDCDIALHAITHLMFDSDLADKLRDLVDIDDLLTCFARRDAEFWEHLLERAVELDLTRPTYYGLRYSSSLLKSDIPDWVLGRISAWAPITPVGWLMDLLVPYAIIPPHPEQSGPATSLCRLMLYIRSHWIRMPPWLLAYHLTVKFLRKQLGSDKYSDNSPN